jgi:hypothetical protein
MRIRICHQDNIVVSSLLLQTAAADGHHQKPATATSGDDKSFVMMPEDCGSMQQPLIQRSMLWTDMCDLSGFLCIGSVANPLSKLRSKTCYFDATFAALGCNV